MAQRDAETLLRRLTNTGEEWCRTGTVTSIATHAAWGWLLTVTLQPSGREVEARPKWPAIGNGSGVFFPVEIGAEVLVHVPNGDINNAVAYVGLTSSEAKVPDDWDNDTVRVDGGGDYDVEAKAGSGSTQATLTLNHTTGAVSISCTDVTVTASGTAVVDSTDVRLGGSAATSMVALASKVEANEAALRVEAIAHTHPVVVGGTTYTTGTATGIGPTAGDAGATRVQAV